MKHSSAGKGDLYRPHSKKKMDDNWSRIDFRKICASCKHVLEGDEKAGDLCISCTLETYPIGRCGK